jgi:ASC-1-like (ASCH) protein
MRTKTLWIKEEYLALIRAGRKTVEVRVGYTNIARLQPGDRLLLNSEDLYTIQGVRRYTDFDEMLRHEDPAAIAPGFPPGELLPALRALYPAEKEALGVIALELAPAPSDGEQPPDDLKTQTSAP